jgi:hypothetical protein
MNTRVQWRHDNELGWRPEIDGPVRVAPELQEAWNMYYGQAGSDRTVRDISGGDSSAALRDPQRLWDRDSDRAVPRSFSVGPEPFSPFAH